MKTATKTTDQYKDRTDGPWELDPVWMLIKGPNGEEVCAIHSGQNDGSKVYRHIAQGNAELICRAVNCHAELLEVCKFILSQLDPNNDHPKTQCVLYSDCLSPKETDDQSVVEYLKEVISKAEGQ